MKQRFMDPRVGYFTKSVQDLDHYPENPRWVQLATRWDLQPKPEDMPRYLRGELVEPVKPIIFYIDRNTPGYLVPYFIDGVNEWRRAFEKAGFKNAITALPEPPADDTTYSLEDVRFSYISYKASPIPNAYGPSVCDPRSGEIISSRVAVFHNIMDLIQRWYFAMCATNDPAARQFPLSRDVMGRLVKNVITHEVGHALGLRHNFAGSSTYDVDSIRNPAFVKANGFGASVMDYMRFNYVVQPEDKMPVELLLPNLGVYDFFAIEWGYRYWPEFKSPKAEADSLERWVSAKRKDERLIFGKETDLHDPRFQSEDVGSNAAKAGELGMKNLRTAMLHFDEWMTAMKADDIYYGQQYRSMLGRYHNYLNHALRTLGGRYNNEDALPSENMPAFIPVSKAKQEEAVAFLEQYIMHYPEWLFPPKITDKAGFIFDRDGAEPFAVALSKFFMAYSRILQNEVVAGDKGYHASTLFDRIYSSVYGKLAKGQPVNEFDRLLQRTLLASMISNAASKAGFSKDVSVQLLILIGKVQAGCKAGMPLAKDVLTKAHLQSMADMITIWETGTGQGLLANK
ncbi:zinc-dependent metalloprotease [Chitinophaga sedimenti]|uniref:zinc-dependent metalloprotease n=1 Tax=Chitinophaga sedimenti TaxID=2033606 RepID=UPI00249ED9C6|nr:zinc-dependent metalloprotease [Chitinophaga sedimenti]